MNTDEPGSTRAGAGNGWNFSFTARGTSDSSGTGRAKAMKGPLGTVDYYAAPRLMCFGSVGGLGDVLFRMATTTWLFPGREGRLYRQRIQRLLPLQKSPPDQLSKESAMRLHQLVAPGMLAFGLAAQTDSAGTSPGASAHTCPPTPEGNVRLQCRRAPSQHPQLGLVQHTQGQDGYASALNGPTPTIPQQWCRCCAIVFTDSALMRRASPHLVNHIG